MFAKYLLGFDQDMADLFAETFGSATRTGSSVMLTIDGELCDYAYDLMDDYWGAVVLMNYKTGEVLCSVSQPTFDPNYMQEYIDGERELAASAMVNRVTMGKYTPGSTFKTVTLIAALRYIPGVTERTFDCDGALVFDRETGKYLPDVAVDDAEFVQADQETDYDREQEGVQNTASCGIPTAATMGRSPCLRPTPIPAIPPLPSWPWRSARIRWPKPPRILALGMSSCLKICFCIPAAMKSRIRT